MKKKISCISFLLFCFLITQSQIKQHLSLDKKEKLLLADMDVKKPLDTTKKLEIEDTVVLYKYQKQLLTDMVKQIGDNIKTTIDLLDDANHMQTQFYTWLWGGTTISTLQADLKIISNSLSREPYKKSLAANRPLYALDQTISNILTQPKFWNIDFSLKGNQLETDIKMGVPLNHFLIKYAAEVNEIAKNKMAVKSNLEDLFLYYRELKSLHDEISGALKETYKDTKDTNLEQLYTLHKYLENYRQNSRFIKQLQTPFYQQWLWLSGGNIQLQPLDFVTKSYIDTVPEHDMLLNTIDKRGFILRNQRMMEKNEIELKKIKTIETVLNRIIYPIQTSQNHQYLFYDAQTKPFTNEVVQMKPLDDKEKIFVVVNNIPANSIIKLRNLETKDIANSSPTEIIIDSVGGGLVTLINLVYPQISHIASVIGKLDADKNIPTVHPKFEFNKNNFALKMDQKAFSVERKSIDFLLSDEPQVTSSEFWNTVTTNAKDVHASFIKGDNSDMSYFDLKGISDIKFQTELFDASTRKFKEEVEKAIKAQNLKLLDTLQTRIIGDYASKLREKRIVPIVLDHLRNDSVYVAKLISIINYSSMPIMELKPEPDNNPILRTSIEVFDQKLFKDDKMEVQKITPSTKDTLALSTFESKKGKSQIWDLSAGVAYTFVPVVVNEVTVDDAGLKVSSDTYQYRMSVAIHLYPFKRKGTGRRGVFKIDEPFFGPFENRFNFMVGVGIPDPLDNIYAGIGYDFGPGLKLNTGIHLHKYKKYEVTNNQITNKSTIYGISAPYLSLGISPRVLVNIIKSAFK
jgi:hypothetical protein